MSSSKQISSGVKSAENMQKKDAVKWTVRKMTHNDIEQCLIIWKDVKLTEAHSTVATSLAADPNGFYVAQLEPSGQVIGMCSATITRTDTAFIGFYAVDTNYQRIGIGKELWKKTLARFEETDTNIGLYAVPAMSEKYKKNGFIVEDTIRMLIFESLHEADAAADNTKLDTSCLANESQFSDCKIDQITAKSSAILFNKLVEYDATIQKFPRRKLLNYYLRPSNNDFEPPLTIAVVRKKTNASSCCCEQETVASSLGADSTKMDEKLAAQTESKLNTCDYDDIEIVGYGCIRSDNTFGAMVGPIYADSSELAELVLKSLVDRYDLKQGRILSVMSLSSNPKAADILRKLGLQEMEQCARMFTKFVPTAEMDKIFFVHSPNFSLF